MKITYHKEDTYVVVTNAGKTAEVPLYVDADEAITILKPLNLTSHEFGKVAAAVGQINRMRKGEDQNPKQRYYEEI